MNAWTREHKAREHTKTHGHTHTAIAARWVKMNKKVELR